MKKFPFLILSFFLVLFLIIFLFLSFNLERSLILEDYIKQQESVENDLFKALKKTGFRLVSNEPIWFDPFLKKHYKRVSYNEEYIRSEKDLTTHIVSKPYYLTVKNTSTISRINKEKERRLFEDFSHNIEKEIEFTPIDNLSLNRRIVLSEKNASPVIFYKGIKIFIYNKNNKRDYNAEKKMILRSNDHSLPIILGFAGDLVIEEFVKSSIKKHGVDHTFNEVNDILKIPEIMSVNLEFTVSERGEREKKHFAFRANENEFKLISGSPIDYVCNANNHSMDYGPTSLLETIKYLDKYGIYHSGSGENIKKAFEPARIKKRGNKFSYFSICDVPDEIEGYETMKNFTAKENKAGIAFYDIERLKELFKKEKRLGNTIIVQFHTGLEYESKPSRRHKRTAKKLIDIGADAVISHHPHFINGVEIYKNKLIAYSLGNFLLDIQKDLADEGIILFLFVKENKILSWSFYPVVSHFGAVSVKNKRILEVEKRFIKLTSDLL